MIELWARRAILADPSVLAWQRDDAVHLPSQDRAAPDSLEELERLIVEAHEAEGGAAAVAAVTAEVTKAHARDLASCSPARRIARRLPNRLRVQSPASELVARSPVLTLMYPSRGATACLSVLRDARLGRLSALSDLLAERYLIPASEIVFCILTGHAPNVPPIRLATRFRRFDVDGMPVTATSRLVLDVDPQLDPAEVARTFAHWQRVNGVTPAKPSPKLVPLATNLLGRLSLVPAEQHAQSNAHPSELLGIGARSWWLVPEVPWVRLARETNCDPHLIRARAAAVVRLLLPLDAPRAPRWLDRGS